MNERNYGCTVDLIHPEDGFLSEVEAVASALRRLALMAERAGQTLTCHHLEVTITHGHAAVWVAEV